MFSDSNNPLSNHICIYAICNVQWVSQVKILNQNTCVPLFRSNLGRLRSNQTKLVVNTTEESHTIDLLSIQKDKYKNTYQILSPSLLNYSRKKWFVQSRVIVSTNFHTSNPEIFVTKRVKFSCLKIKEKSKHNYKMAELFDRVKHHSS